jgi:hypothetical protein
MAEGGAIGGKGVMNSSTPSIEPGRARDKAGARIQVAGSQVGIAAKVLAKATPEILESARTERWP